MSAIPYPLDPMGSNLGPYFELVVKPGILGDSLTYGFTPYWNTGGYCKVVDWGDGSGEDATASGTTLKHTYAAAGTYTISIKADCYKISFGVWPNQVLVYDSNGNWDAMGNITTGDNMFANCGNAVFNFSELPKGMTSAPYMFFNCAKAKLPLTSLPSGLKTADHMFIDCASAELNIYELPSGLTNGSYMFQNCRKAKLPLTSLPDVLTNGSYMFDGCTNATLPLTSLPAGLTDGQVMFYSCTNATLTLTSLPDGLTGLAAAFSYVLLAEINLDDLTANAPEGGWTEVTSIGNMFYNAGSGNSPGTVTGSRSAFLAKFPNVTNTTNAFYGTNTTE